MVRASLADDAAFQQWRSRRESVDTEYGSGQAGSAKRCTQINGQVGNSPPHGDLRPFHGVENGYFKRKLAPPCGRVTLTRKFNDQ